MYVDEHKINCNPEYLINPEFVVVSDEVNPFVINYTVEVVKTLFKFKIYLYVNIPENNNDREFQKVFLKTVIDSDKFFNDVYANPFVRFIVGFIFKSAQFELKLPFKPVSPFVPVFKNK